MLQRRLSTSVAAYRKAVPVADAHTRGIQVKRICLQHGVEAGLKFVLSHAPSVLSHAPSQYSAGGKPALRWVSQGESSMWCTVLDQAGHQGAYHLAVQVYLERMQEAVKDTCGDRALTSVINSIGERLVGIEGVEQKAPLVRQAVEIYNSAHGHPTRQSVFALNALFKVCLHGGTRAFWDELVDGKTGLLLWRPAAIDVITRTAAINAGSVLGVSTTRLVEMYHSEPAPDERLLLALLGALKRVIRAEPHHMQLVHSLWQGTAFASRQCHSEFMQVCVHAGDVAHVTALFEKRILPQWQGARERDYDPLVAAMALSAYVQSGRPGAVFPAYESLRKVRGFRDHCRTTEMLIRAAGEEGQPDSLDKADRFFWHHFASRANLRRKHPAQPNQACIDELLNVWRRCKESSCTSAAVGKWQELVGLPLKAKTAFLRQWLERSFPGHALQVRE